MPVVNFPSSPAVNDTYTIADKIWIWNGVSWTVFGSGVAAVGDIGPAFDKANAANLLAFTANANAAAGFAQANTATTDAANARAHANSAYAVANTTTYTTGNVAVQSVMEAATSNGQFVVPLYQHKHPGHPKCWAQVTGGGTPALGVAYNVASITDVAAGNVRFNLTTAMSSVNWACMAIAGHVSTTIVQGASYHTMDATTVMVVSVTEAGSAADPSIGYSMIGFGDQ